MTTIVTITGDDFGRNSEVNGGILEAVRHGLNDRVSIIPNMAWTEEALEMAHAYGFTSRLGIHINLTEGQPLSSPISGCRRFCGSDGHFYMWRSGTPACRLSRSETIAVATEVRAQFQRLIKFGLNVDTCDGHHHVHTEPGVLHVLLHLRRELGVHTIRIGRNLGRDRTISNKAYKALLNGTLIGLGLARSRYFGSVEDVSTTGVHQLHGDLEVMTHPLLTSRGLEDASSPGTGFIDYISPVRTPPFAGTVSDIL